MKARRAGARVLAGALAALVAAGAPLSSAAAVVRVPEAMAAGVPLSAPAASALPSSLSVAAFPASPAASAPLSSPSAVPAAALPALPAASIPSAPEAPKAAVSPLKAVPAIPVPGSKAAARLRARAPVLLAAAGAAVAAWIAPHLGLHPAAAAAPFALLAGTLGPSGAPADRFLERARRTAAPGAVLEYGDVSRIGRELGLDSDELGRAVHALLERGELAMRDNHALLVFDFAQRARFEGASQADRDAARATQLMNAASPLEHAQGLALASKAVSGYEADGAADALAEARVLRDNLALEHAGDLLRLHRADVEKRFPADSPFRLKRLAEIDAGLAWMKETTPALGVTLSIDPAVRAGLSAAIEDITPRDAQGRQSDEVVTAWAEAADFIRAVPDGTPRAAAPAPAGGALAKALLEAVPPGALVDEGLVLDLRSQLGLDAAQTREALNAMARAGWLAVLRNKKMVRTSLPSRLESRSLGEDELRPAHELAAQGVRLLNSNDELDHLRAVARLDQARQAYVEVLRGRGSDPVLTEVQVLLGNAVLEAEGDAVRALENALRASLARKREAFAGMTRAQMGAALVRAQKAAAWLNATTYSSLKRPETPRETARTLRDLLDLRAFREVVGGKIDGDMEVVRGVRLVRAYLDRGAEGDRVLVPGMGEPEVPATPGGFRPLPKSEYKTLLEYGTDLTQKAEDGALRPLIGRRAELRQMVKTLLRVEKNNPLVIGSKGVGKTAVVNGLARMIAQGEIPELRGKNVVKIDLNKVVAGTTLRGQFEERMHKIIDEAKKSDGRVILFIDEIHMIVGSGDAAGGNDASQILKESLSDGSISLIGATTTDEYRRIEKDGALMRRFNPVKLAPPTKDEAEAILDGVKPLYEKKHAVTILTETLKAAVALASRYVTDRHLPDSALDLLDDASAEVELKASEAKAGGKDEGKREVTPEDVAQEISLRTGIPAGKLGEDELTKLKGLPAELKTEVVGQDEAVEKVAEAVQAGKLGYRDPKQPIASFVFLGPTGVGKTELARALARKEFGSEKNMLRLDMSEYQEKSSVSRLISAPPGYVGHEEGGQLTEPIRRNPYQVILLDEIEKANPEVFDVLLQVLEDGRLTDGQGRTVDFSNTIIIMTSNIGGSLAGEEAAGPAKKNPIGFIWDEVPKAQDLPQDRRSGYLDAFKQKYRPEFVNRVGEDRVVVFNELTKKEQLGAILDLRVKALEAQLREKGLTVALTPAAREAVLAKALEQKKYGARPIKQIVDRDINRALKDADLDGTITDGDSVLVDWDAAAGRYRASRAP